MEYTEQENEKMQKMLLSPHFALGEFTKSGTAIKHGVDNTPHDIIVVVGAIRITSGYRCHLLNLQVGGAIGSQHELGEAADIFVTNSEVLLKYMEFIRKNCDFDQMILEPRGQPQKRWLHVSYTMRRPNRHQTLK